MDLSVEVPGSGPLGRAVPEKPTNTPIQMPLQGIGKVGKLQTGLPVAPAGGDVVGWIGPSGNESNAPERGETPDRRRSGGECGTDAQADA